MKNFTSLILLFCFFHSYEGQCFDQFLDDKNQKEDTLFIRSLKNEMYRRDEFEVLHVYSFERDRMVFKVLKKGNLIGSIDLPNGNEINNFSFSFVQEEMMDGFVLSAVCGMTKVGMDGAKFFFTYSDGTFYLDRSEVEISTHGRKKFVRNTGLKVPINQVVIKDYFK